MSVITSGRYYDHAIHVISQFVPSILTDIYGNDDYNNVKRDDAITSSTRDSIIDVEIIDDT